ncbi:hypothetical protein [Gordoniibacillus kamchatkensis]|nr:hypothetical protein [Paenibacillus sp. VKM B-2647]
MPDEKLRTETDGDPTTAFEDTQKHERTGLKLGEDDENRKSSHWDGYEI